IVAASDPSLHSLAPKGPSGSMLSTMMGSDLGDSTDDGLRYSSKPGFISKPSFQIISSVSAWPMPIQTEPMIWPSTETGLSARPQSCAAQTLWTVASQTPRGLGRWGPLPLHGPAGVNHVGTGALALPARAGFARAPALHQSHH